jgi:hypothetical protein
MHLSCAFLNACSLSGAGMQVFLTVVGGTQQQQQQQHLEPLGESCPLSHMGASHAPAASKWLR